MVCVIFFSPSLVQMLSGVSASQGAARRRAAWQPFCLGSGCYPIVLAGKWQANSFRSGAGYAAALRLRPALLSVSAVQYKAIIVLLAPCFWKAS